MQSVLRLLPVALLLASTVPILAQQGGGWLDGGPRGDYFPNASLAAPAQFSRSDARLDFAPEAGISWAGSRGSPFVGYPAQNFSVRWTGRLRARFSESYTLRAVSSDGVRVRLRPAGQVGWTTVIDDFAAGDRPGTGEATAVYPFTANQLVEAEVEFRQLTGPAALRLLWSAPSVPEEVIDPTTESAVNWVTYREQTFADAIKAGRSRWEGFTDFSTTPATVFPAPTLDPDGWPQGDGDFIVSEQLVPYDLSPFETGEMRLSFRGRASVSVFGNGFIVPGSVSYNGATNTTTALVTGADFDANVLNLRFRDTDRDGVLTGGVAQRDGVSDIRLMRLIGDGTPGSLPDDALFHPRFRAACDRYSAIRFQRVNDQARVWSDRLSPTNAYTNRVLPYVYDARLGNFGLLGSSGMAHEWEIMLCNELGADYYVTTPHLADDAYLTRLARLVRYGSDATGEPYLAPVANPHFPPLNPNLRVYVEIANELWNFFNPDPYAPFYDFRELIEDKGLANDADFQILNFDNLPLTRSGGYYTNNYTWVRRYWALRLIQLSDLFRGVFGDAQMPGGSERQPRVRPYFTWQYGNANATAETGLRFADDYFNNAAGPFRATPRPVNYYFWSGGGAGYYSSTNALGLVENGVPNASFEVPVLGAPFAVAPAGATWTFTGNAGIARTAVRTPQITAAVVNATTTTAPASWVGMRFTTGPDPQTVYELGRWVSAGNARQHEVRLVRASDGRDVTASYLDLAGAPAGAFVYGRCVPVLLPANTTFYLLSTEASGQDAFGTAASSVTAGAGITVIAPATASLNATTGVFTFADGPAGANAWGPVALRTAPASILASGSALNPPDPQSAGVGIEGGGGQIAWLQSVGGVQSAVEISLPLPAQQSAANRYSLSFRWVTRAQTRVAQSDVPQLRILAIVGGVPVDITPRDANTQPQDWNPGSEWRRRNYFLGDTYFSEVFAGPSGGSVLIRFETQNASGDQVAFLDQVGLTSADAFYAGDIPSTGTATGQTNASYESNQVNDGYWCAAYGLRQMTYEHGFSAGGDSGNSPIQNYAKFRDPRARQTVVDALRLFQQAGGDLATFGTYSTFPAFEPIDGVREEGTLDAGAYPLTQGLDDILALLPAVVTNGAPVPVVLAGANRTLPLGSGAGVSASGNNWNTYHVVVTQPRMYSVGASTTAGGVVEIGVGGNVIATGTSGVTRGGSFYLPYGRHAVRVRAVSGAFNVQQVIVDAASGAPEAPTGFAATVDPITARISLSWVDQSAGATQELWFEIERATDAAFTQNVARFQTLPNATAFADPTDLPVGTTYFYRLRAFNLVGVSAWQSLSVPLAAPAPRDVLFAYDGFDGAVGALHNRGGGFGWATLWNVQNNDVTTPGWEVRNAAPLSYPGYAPFSPGYAVGGRAFLTGGRTLDVAAPPTYFRRTVGGNAHYGADGTTLWLSALVRPDAANVAGVFFALSTNPTTFVQSDWRALIAIQNGRWTVLARNAGGTLDSAESSVNAVVGQTALVVLRCDFGATDTFTLYVNPVALGGAAPVTASASLNSAIDQYFRSIAFYPGTNVNAGSMDEFRVGDSFAAVTRALAAPQLDVPPQPQIVARGATATFTASASGFPAPSYQWRFEGADLPGQTAPTLTLTNVQSAAAGGYSVRVSNFAGSTTSAAVALTVLTPLEFWRLTNFGSAANAGLGANDTLSPRDGLPNLVKYALGVAPGSSAFADASAPVASIYTAPDAQRYPEITFVRDPRILDVRLTVEVNADLAGVWQTGTSYLGAAATPQPAVSSEIERTPLPDGRERVRVRSAVSIAADPAQFLRLRATEE